MSSVNPYTNKMNDTEGVGLGLGGNRTGPKIEDVSNKVFNQWSSLPPTAPKPVAAATTLTIPAATTSAVYYPTASTEAAAMASGQSFPLVPQQAPFAVTNVDAKYTVPANAAMIPSRSDFLSSVGHDSSVGAEDFGNSAGIRSVVQDIAVTDTLANAARAAGYDNHTALAIRENHVATADEPALQALENARKIAAAKKTVQQKAREESSTVIAAAHVDTVEALAASVGAMTFNAARKDALEVATGADQTHICAKAIREAYKTIPAELSKLKLRMTGNFTASALPLHVQANSIANDAIFEDLVPIGDPGVVAGPVDYTRALSNSTTFGGMVTNTEWKAFDGNFTSRGAPLSLVATSLVKVYCARNITPQTPADAALRTFVSIQTGMTVWPTGLDKTQERTLLGVLVQVILRNGIDLGCWIRKSTIHEPGLAPYKITVIDTAALPILASMSPIELMTGKTVAKIFREGAKTDVKKPTIHQLQEVVSKWLAPFVLMVQQANQRHAANWAAMCHGAQIAFTPPPAASTTTAISPAAAAEIAKLKAELAEKTLVLDRTNKVCERALRCIHDVAGSLCQADRYGESLLLQEMKNQVSATINQLFEPKYIPSFTQFLPKVCDKCALNNGTCTIGCAIKLAQEKITHADAAAHDPAYNSIRKAGLQEAAEAAVAMAKRAAEEKAKADAKAAAKAAEAASKKK